MSTMSAMSTFVTTTTTTTIDHCCVAAAAREMTAPTKNWWQQQGGTFTPENMQNALKQHNKNRALNISWNANLEHMKIN